MMKSLNGIAVLLVWVAAARAGGGGENMLLVVNPNDENSLRVANAYAQIRNIPDRNIVFLSLPQVNGLPHWTTSGLVTGMLTPIQNAMNSRNLNGQIDYIATIGQPYAAFPVSTDGSGTMTSFTAMLSRLDTIAANSTPGIDRIATAGWSSLTSGASPLYAADGYTLGSNTAIHHSQTQWYMAGAAAFTGFQGNTADQAIANLRRTAGGDGSKPAGTVYFEENNDVRSDTREGQWPAVRQALTARGIAWIQESNTPGATPRNRGDVRGAVVGLDRWTVPNGSTYTPGSWADSLTSFGSHFGERTQSKATSFLAAGAGGTSGTVTEPYAIASRFPHGMIHAISADGSTLGESFFKSVFTPQLQMFIGDMLAQPYADVPQVTLGAGLSSGSTISGAVQIQASATVSRSATTNGVANLKLYIDGQQADAKAGTSGTFDLNTQSLQLGGKPLSDGWHELRVVAVNDSAAQSEGSAIVWVQVNNHNRSISGPEGALSATGSQVLSVPLGTAKGDGTVSRVELRHLGRSLVSGTGNSLNLDSSKLAYGENRIVPVAVFSDGSEVAGEAFTVRRDPVYLPGQKPLAAAYRQPGVKVEYFAGKGATSVAASNFTGPATLEVLHNVLDLGGGSASGMVETMPVGLSTDKLALRATGLFEVAADQAGEFKFFFFETNDSVQLKIDGQAILGFDDLQAKQTSIMWAGQTFLSAGEHRFELLASNTVVGDTRFGVSLYYRGPDGLTNLVGNGFAYQSVPEPGLALLAVGGLLGLRRPRRRN